MSQTNYSAHAFHEGFANGRAAGELTVSASGFTFRTDSMGRRRPWIIGSQFMMAVTLLGILWLGDFDRYLG